MPFVTYLGTDKREGNLDKGAGIENPAFSDVEKALRRLDGDVFTQVHLEGEDKTMDIGGGNGGKYNVYIAVDVDREFYNLIDQTAAPVKEIELCTGGQMGIFEARQCVDLEHMLRAAKLFFELGEPASDLCWEHKQ